MRRDASISHLSQSSLIHSEGSNYSLPERRPPTLRVDLSVVFADTRLPFSNGLWPLLLLIVSQTALDIRHGSRASKIPTQYNPRHFSAKRFQSQVRDIPTALLPRGGLGMDHRYVRRLGAGPHLRAPAQLRHPLHPHPQELQQGRRHDHG